MNKSLAIGALTLNNSLILAPMAGITDLPLRLIARENGAALCFTEMISAHGLVRNGKKTFTLLRSTGEDRPLGLQLFGDDPRIVSEGARIIEEYGDLIDINMGCPVRKVVNSGAGSALMREPEKVRAMIAAVRRSTKLPLTIKIRTGWDSRDPSFMEIARIAQEEGCDAVTLHPRNRSDMFNNKADWGKIGELKSRLRIPVIGSGDLFTARDIKAMFEQTGCDGVMVARGVLGNPWIFSEALALLSGRGPAPVAPAERLATAERHMELLVEVVGEETAARELRKHLAWYTKGLSGSAQVRDAVNRAGTLDDMKDILRTFFFRDHR